MAVILSASMLKTLNKIPLESTNLMKWQHCLKICHLQDFKNQFVFLRYMRHYRTVTEISDLCFIQNYLIRYESLNDEFFCNSFTTHVSLNINSHFCCYMNSDSQDLPKFFSWERNIPKLLVVEVVRGANFHGFIYLFGLGKMKLL